LLVSKHQIWWNNVHLQVYRIQQFKQSII
jgi:hypothetical protein